MGSRDDDEPIDSADQDAWVNFSERLRTRLSARLKDIPKMKIEDLRIYTLAVDDAFSLHQRSLLFDKTVQRALARELYDD